MKRIYVILALLGTFGLMAWKLLDNQEKVAEKVYRPDPNRKVGVRTTAAGVRNLAEEGRFLGSFIPNREIEIRPQAGGEVVQLPIEEGQSVGAGRLIAKLDDEQLHYQLEALEVNVEGYRNDLKRYEALVKGDATPAVNLEKTGLSIRATEAQMKQLQKQIRNTTITAPFSGIVTEKLVEKGSVVSPGTPIAKITDISTLKLVVSVPEKAVNRFRVGQRIPVQTEVYPDIPLTGRVTMIGVQGDASHNYPVEITVENSPAHPLKGGMYGSVANTGEGKGRALAVPRQALVGSTRQPQVFVVEDGKAVLRKVAIGAATNDYYEITDGLKAGEQVVTSGQINLRNGTPVVAQ
ncbi:efflux RND transporter periplasmic adaptor subunit [Larkinella soli]|uniref:efflux RND transporter periplasmic adaptor subunit n=1 Tax=Larkinella soli TaxID=1770527 RepID=UPI000FFC4751|nr:efflux RND transporter periplasmic adaptor subunit [Larkinella soli]